MTEREIGEKLHQWFKAGAKARQTGETCPHAGGSLASQIHVYGWLKEDLRIALMRANPAYAAEQERFGQGLSHLPA